MSQGVSGVFVCEYAREMIIINNVMGEKLLFAKKMSGMEDDPDTHIYSTTLYSERLFPRVNDMTIWKSLPRVG